MPGLRLSNPDPWGGAAVIRRLLECRHSLLHLTKQIKGHYYMELCDPQQLSTLRLAFKQSTDQRRPRMTSLSADASRIDYPRQQKSKDKRNCRCTRCPTCIE